MDFIINLSNDQDLQKLLELDESIDTRDATFNDILESLRNSCLDDVNVNGKVIHNFPFC